MLKVNNNGVTITLTGKSSLDSTFMLAGFLLLLAIAVIVAMSLFSVKASIGSLAILVCGCFVFNKLKQQQSVIKTINSGQLEVTKGLIIHIDSGKKTSFLIEDNDRIEQQQSNLIVYDKDNQKKCEITSFESAKEVEVMHKVLQGQAMSKRNANIRMQ